MLNKLIIILLIFFNSYAAQSYIIEDKPAYFQISADTIGVPIYIDGALIGHTPIETQFQFWREFIILPINRLPLEILSYNMAKQMA